MPKHPSGFTITVKRQALMQMADRILLDALRGGGWMTGQAIAVKTGWSFRSAVGSLSRLIAGGKVESQWVMQRRLTVNGKPNNYQVREYREKSSKGVPGMVDQINAVRRSNALTRRQPSIRRPPPCLMCGERGEHHQDCQLQA